MRGTPTRFSDFRGGLNTKDSPYELDTNQARDMLNVVSSTRGAILKRNGNTTFSSPANQLHSLIASESTASKFLVGVGGTKAFSISTGGASTDITGGATITTGLRMEIITAPASGGQGPIYMNNGTDTPLYWTGAGNVASWTAASGTLPVGKYMVYHANRLWVAGTSANPSRLFWSDLADPRVWPAANVVDFDPTDGDAITGLGTFGPYLLVFKRYKVFVVYDDATGANRRISRGIGAVSHRSIVETPQGTFFLTGDKGVYVTDGQTVRQVSELITPTTDSIIDTQKVNAAGAYFKNHYYLSVCTSGSAANRTLDYDLELKSWWLHSNGEAEFTIWKPISGEELYGANDNSAKVDRCYVAATNQDNGANYDAYWISAWHSFGSPFLKKRLRQVHFDGSGTVDFYIANNFSGGHSIAKSSIFTTGGSTFGGTGTYGDTTIFGDVAAVQEAISYTQGVGRVWSVKFLCQANATFMINGYTLNTTMRQSSVIK